MNEFETKLFSEELRVRLWKRCLALTMNEDDAEDLQQNTYLKAIENKEKFDGKAIDRWTFTICRNLFYDSKRKKREYLPGKDLPEISVPSPEEGIIIELDLKMCLEELDENEREILSMIPSSSYNEMAEELEISKSNLRVKICRAREKLAQCLELAA